MTAKEFRVGNFVRQPNRLGRVQEVWREAVRIEGYNNAYDYNHTEPIPITEEWLIDFGFDLVVKEGNQGEFRVYQLNEITYNTNHGWWWRHRLPIQPRFIHELQNLFYAITGKELNTLNEKPPVSDFVISLTLKDITKIVNAFSDFNIPVESVKEEIELTQTK